MGVDRTGRYALANGDGGVVVDGGIGNLIGGTSPGAGNVISGNGSQYGRGGVTLGSNSGSPGYNAVSNVVQGNLIGTDAAGSLAIGNAGSGVLLLSYSATNRIGGSSPGASNIISGNLTGIELFHTWDNQVQGNLVGTDSTGVAPLGNRYDGIFIVDSPGNGVGGVEAGARNLISGNGRDGIALLNDSSTNNVVRGNYIGTDISDLKALGNARVGILVSGETSLARGQASHNQIGGDAVGAGNLIAGNAFGGIRIVEANATANVVQGNLIGTDVLGKKALGNGDGSGVFIGNAPGNVIGGRTSGARNVISGNNQGLTLCDPGTVGNVVEGNFLGTQDNGINALGNASHAIEITNSASGNIIGGPVPEAANRIAHNAGNGINVLSGTGNTFSRNWIFSNGALGINLGAAGVTPNDADDSDAGPNALQNFPDLVSAVRTSGSTVVAGVLHTLPNTTSVLDFFGNQAGDTSGNGEGETPLGSISVTTDESGQVAFSADLPPVAVGTFITATATDSLGNTSEFSAWVQVTDVPTTHALNVSKAGNGVGQVMSQPIGIDCGTDCSEEYPAGTVVKLTAHPEVGSTFAGWSGDGEGEAERTVTLDAAKSVTATFNLSVAPSADVALAMWANDTSVSVGSNLTYTMSVTNHGPTDASGAMLTNTLPENVDLVSVTASQGSLTTNGNVLTFTLGTLTNGASTSVVIAVVPVTAGTLTNRAVVSAVESDPDLANNLIALETIVTPASAANHAPTFTKGPDKSVYEDAGPQTVTAWATDISAGIPEESGQALSFVLTNDNNGLFVDEPAITADGTLTFTPAPNANGSVVVTVLLKVDGGTANGGVDTSVAQTLTITVSAVNDAPTFIKGPDQVVNTGAGPQTVVAWATAISAGPPDESSQTLSFVTQNDYESLFEVQPRISSDGTLTYKAVYNAQGEASVMAMLNDIGGTANGGVNSSPPQFFKISIIPPVDLHILARATPNPVAAGSQLVLQLTVTNIRFDAARDVILTAPLPANTTFVGATTSQGAYTLANGVVSCALGSLGGGLSANVSITVVPNVFGSLVATASVGSKGPDVNPADNWVMVGVQVQGPPMMIGGIVSGSTTIFHLIVPTYAVYYSIAQYTDRLGLDAQWTDLPNPPHSGFLTITNNTPYRFYRTILVP